MDCSFRLRHLNSASCPLKAGESWCGSLYLSMQAHACRHCLHMKPPKTEAKEAGSIAKLISMRRLFLGNFLSEPFVNVNILLAN